MGGRPETRTTALDNATLTTTQEEIRKSSYAKDVLMGKKEVSEPFSAVSRPSIRRSVRKKTVRHPAGPRTQPSTRIVPATRYAGQV